MPPKKKLRLVDLLATEPDSKLALHLIRKWSWGLYSATEVSVLAREALADQKVLLEKVGAPANFASRSLEMLANIGSQGSITKNIYTHTNTNTLIHTHTLNQTNKQTNNIHWVQNEIGVWYGGSDGLIVVSHQACMLTMLAAIYYRFWGIRQFQNLFSLRPLCGLRSLSLERSLSRM